MDRKRRTEKYSAPASVPPEPTLPKTAPPTPDKPQRGKHTAYSHQIQGYCPNKAKQPGKRNQSLYVAVIVILTAVFVYASVQVVLYLWHSSQAKQEEQMIQSMIDQGEAEAPQAASSEPAAEQAESPAPSPAAEPAAQLRDSRQEAKPPDVLIQFTKALSINPDTVGQLQMGESIRTYVVQRDNTYYLRHSFSGEYSFSGAIFLDVTCSIYPQNRNLIIHGHNMQDGTAFGKLSRFEDVDYLNKYPFIEFSTLYENARYIPFAVVYYSVDPTSDRYLDVYRINAMTTQEFIRFISKVQLMLEYHIPVNVAGTDKILTITTCASGDEDVRFAVFAVKDDRF